MIPPQPLQLCQAKGPLPNCSPRWICGTVFILIPKDRCLQTHPQMSMAQGPQDVGVPQPPSHPLPDDGDHLLQLVPTSSLANSAALPSRPDRPPHRRKTFPSTSVSCSLHVAGEARSALDVGFLASEWLGSWSRVPRANLLIGACRREDETEQHLKSHASPVRDISYLRANKLQQAAVSRLLPAL